MLNAPLATSAAPRLLWHTESRQPRQMGLFFYPTTLLGGLWLQLALSIEGNRQYKKCVTCHQPFVLIPQHDRVNRLHCSRSCRTLHWLHAKEEKQHRAQTRTRSRAGVQV
jgi:hypothetical protein